MDGYFPNDIVIKIKHYIKPAPRSMSYFFTLSPVDCGIELRQRSHDDN